MTDIVKGRGSNISGQQAATAQQTEDAQSRSLPGARRTQQGQIWSERQLIWKPSAEYVGGHQPDRCAIDIEAEYEKRGYVFYELLESIVGFGSLREPHMFQTTSLSAKAE